MPRTKTGRGKPTVKMRMRTVMTMLLLLLLNLSSANGCPLWGSLQWKMTLPMRIVMVTVWLLCVRVKPRHRYVPISCRWEE